MYCTRKVTDGITWIGGSDRRLALFENLFPIPRGVAYNSYLIQDEKTAVIDTVDSSISRQFFENIHHELGDRKLDYLIVNHMEPDHCANIAELLLRYPDMKLVGNAKTFCMIGQFYGFELKDEQKIVVKEGDSLSLGKHKLSFYFAPMVHWPEVMVAYEETEKVLFSADAFGSFGALNGNIFNDELDFDHDWLDDARRYYGNIVGKYGPQVQAALKKLSGLDIAVICPLHGPVWRSDLGYLLEKYDLWSRYEPEEKTVAILYASMYGDTENAANVLAAKLAEAGVKNIAMHDVSGTHVSELISEVFRCSHLVLAAPTYNNGIYPAMLNFLHDCRALNLQNRTIGLIENGTWGPVAAKQMKEILDGLKNMNVLEPVVTVKSALNEASMEQLEALAGAVAASLAE
ncbi:MAG TPA: FprA family A-type flavoprotein [Candidatus Eisenbergiella intestinipullorum]|nr:FprA family A-type flavoprotein [Candidatus Eisenbergiella intestinipullorum]